MEHPAFNLPWPGVGDQFLLCPDAAFLNHGSFGACPKPVFDAYQDWQRLAWTGALIITLAVLVLSILARILAAQRKES